jgi:membrane-associated phospholipid phosphatase
VIDYTREDFADAAQRYDLILDTAGRRSLSHLRRVLTPQGTLVIVGGEGPRRRRRGTWTREGSHHRLKSERRSAGRCSQRPLISVVLNRRCDELCDPAAAVHQLSTAGAAPAWRLGPEGSHLATSLLATLAACTLAFSKLAEEMAGGELVSIDGTVVVWLHSHATGLATLLLSAVTSLGGTQVLLAVTLLATVGLLARRRIAHAALMGAAFAGGEALNSALKAAFERPRPSFSDPLATAAGYSFPSGHAMVSLTVYGGLAFVIAASVGSRRAQLLVLISAIVLVLAIGFSRVYLGVHYASDVLAAYSAGLAWLTLCALTLLGASRLRARKHRSGART